MPLDYWTNLPTMARLLSDRRADVRDDGDDGPVLLDALPQVVDEPDVHLR